MPQCVPKKQNNQKIKIKNIHPSKQEEQKLPLNIWRGNFLVAQWFKDLAWALLWCRYDLWPGNYCMPQAWPYIERYMHTNWDVFFFLATPWHAEVPQPGIKPMPPQWPEPQQWQHQILTRPPGNSKHFPFLISLEMSPWTVSLMSTAESSFSSLMTLTA